MIERSLKIQKCEQSLNFLSHYEDDLDKFKQQIPFWMIMCFVYIDIMDGHYVAEQHFSGVFWGVKEKFANSHSVPLMVYEIQAFGVQTTSRYANVNGFVVHAEF